MSPDQAQAQSPLPDQPIREGQLDEDKGQDGHPQDESPKQGHLIGEGDGIPGEAEEGEAPDEIPAEGSDARRSKGNAQRP